MFGLEISGSRVGECPIPLWVVHLDEVVWNPKLSEKPVDLEVNLDEVVEICDEIEEKEAEVFGP